MTSLSGLRSSLSQEDLPVHPGSIINLAPALSSEPLSGQGPFSALPTLSKHFLFTFSASSARICSKAGGRKKEVLFAWSVPGKEMATERWTKGALFSYVTGFMEYISSLKNGMARTDTAEMTVSHTSNVMSQTTIVNTCISYWILYPHYRESVVHLSKVSSFRIFHSVCIGTVLPFLSACFVSLLEKRFLL